MSEVSGSGDLQSRGLEPVPASLLAGHPTNDAVEPVSSGYDQANSVLQGLPPELKISLTHLWYRFQHCYRPFLVYRWLRLKILRDFYQKSSLSGTVWSISLHRLGIWVRWCCKG